MIAFDERRQQVHQGLARTRPVLVRDVRTSRENLDDVVPLLVVEEAGRGIAVQRSKSLQQPAVVQRDHLRLLHVRDVARLAALMLTAVDVVEQIEVVEVPDAELPERVQVFRGDGAVGDVLGVEVVGVADSCGPIGLLVLHQVVGVAAVTAALRVWRRGMHLGLDDEIDHLSLCVQTKALPEVGGGFPA